MKKKAKKAAKKAAKKPAKRPVKKAPKKKAPKRDYENYHLPVRSEAEQMREMSDDLRDAWQKLRGFANSLGDYKFHTSAKAMMFTRRLCFMFARPKKSYLEVVFFLPEVLDHPHVRKGNRVSKTRAANNFRLVHADQVDAPFTDWVRAAFEFAS